MASPQEAPREIPEDFSGLLQTSIQFKEETEDLIAVWGRVNSNRASALPDKFQTDFRTLDKAMREVSVNTDMINIRHMKDVGRSPSSYFLANFVRHRFSELLDSHEDELRGSDIINGKKSMMQDITHIVLSFHSSEVGILVPSHVFPPGSVYSSHQLKPDEKFDRLEGIFPLDKQIIVGFMIESVGLAISDK